MLWVVSVNNGFASFVAYETLLLSPECHDKGLLVSKILAFADSRVVLVETVATHLNKLWRHGATAPTLPDG